MEKKASRVSSSSQRRKRVPDEDRHVGRRQGLRGWRQFKELQDNESEKKTAVREVKCPRESWQGWPEPILRALAHCLGRPWGLAAVARELCQQGRDISCSSPTEVHRKLFPGLFLAMGASCFVF